MANMREVSAISAITECSIEDLVEGLSGIDGIDDIKPIESRNGVDLLRFETDEGYQFMALKDDLLACTSQETIEELSKMGDMKSIKPYIFTWAIGPCKRECAWLLNQAKQDNSIGVRGCILRLRDEEGIFTFDFENKKIRQPVLSTVESLITSGFQFSLFSVAFDGPENPFEQIAIDFDGKIKARTRAAGDDEWIPEVLKYSFDIHSKCQFKVRDFDDISKRRRLPFWLKNIYSARRWDK